MKKTLLILVALLALAFPCMAGDTVQQSVTKTASALVATGAGELYGIIVTTDGTNAQTIDIYDNTSAAGSKLIPTTVITTSATDRVQVLSFSVPVRFNTGVYVNVSGSGTMGYMVYFKR